MAPKASLGHQIENTYRPLPYGARHGVALCLSGGGFRAALFHLGALRRLNELGVLAKISTISSVSGGSIVAAFLADRIVGGLQWRAPYPIGDFEEQVAKPLRKFTRCNLRTRAIANRTKPWKWAVSSAGVQGLERQYRRRLTQLRLMDLPTKPRFVLSASDLVFGQNWVFDSDRRNPLGAADQKGAGPGMGHYECGFGAHPQDWHLARAVAASSCFPPVFNPLPIRMPASHFVGGDYAEDDRDGLVENIVLSDGGVIDNMGLEPVWLDHKVVLVSDGGTPFAPEIPRGLWWRLQRYQSVQGRQGAETRKRWLISNYREEMLDGAYWGIGSSPQRYYETAPGYSKSLARDVFANLRTDMDCFFAHEAVALETHGYYLTDAAIKTHMDRLITTAAPFTMPPPSASDELVIRRQLARSGRRSLIGRGRVVWSEQDLCR